MAERRRFDIEDVSGGMNPDRHALNIEDNEAADLLNFRIDRLGNLVGRQGQQAYGPEAPDDSRVLALGRWVGTNRLNDYRLLVALDDGTIRTLGNVGGVIEYSAPLYTGLDTAAEGMFLEVEDLVLYANGVDDIVAYDGTTVLDLDIPAPSTFPISLSTTSGTLTGTYRYAISYVSQARGMESPAYARGTPETINGGTITILPPTSSHPWVDTVNIYRTTDGGATFMFIGSVPNDGTGFDDDGSATLSPLVTPVMDSITPGEDMGKRAENIAYHQGRLWVSIDDEIYWSRPYQLNLFPYYTNTKVPFEGNDKITALKAFQDYLVVFGELNTVLVAGDGGTSGLDIQLIRQDTDIGATSRDAMVEVDNQLLFLSARGMYVFPGFGEFGSKLSRTICDATVGCRQDASMVYVPTERAVWLSITDQTWVVHLPNQGISRYDFYMRKPLSGGPTKVGLPVWVHALHARVEPVNATHVVEYGGARDYGDPIPHRYISKIWHMDAPGFMKFWRRFGVFTITGTDSDVTATISCPDTLRTYTFPLQVEDSGTTSLWAGSNVPPADRILWDGFSWSTEGLGYYINPLPAHSLYGRSMQTTINSASVAEIEVHTPISFTFRTSDRFLGR